MRTTRIVTAAAKARSLSTATAGTKSTAAKRKTRADETDDGDDELGEFNARRTTRARPGKASDAEGRGNVVGAASSSNLTTRSRAVRKVPTELPNEDKSGSSRLRGRPRKGSLAESEGAAPEQTKRLIRARPGAAVKAIPDEPKVKKIVKFQEAGKENISLASKAKTASSASGLRGRPARRGNAAMSNPSSKASSQPSETGPKKPLSPKKVTQMPVSRDRESSEDELAGDDEMRPMSKGPTKPPTNMAISHKLSNSAPGEHQGSTTADTTILSMAPVAAILASPPRRPPTSPTKDSLKSPAKRPGCGVQLPGSLLKPRSLPSGDQQGQPALLQSPAKRPPSPIKGLTFHSMTGVTPLHGQPSIKSSLLQSPAKRAMPGVKPLAQTPYGEDTLLTRTPKMQPIVATSSNANTGGRPSQLLLAEELDEGETDSVADDPFTGPIDSPRFPGRMSAVLPRHADPLLNEEATEDETDDDELSQVDSPTREEVEHADAGDVPLNNLAPAESFEPSGANNSEDSIALEDIASEMQDTCEIHGPRATVNEVSPGAKKGTMFQLRGSVLDPCRDFRSDFESEDDLSPLKQLPAQRSRSDRKSINARSSLYATQRDSRRSTIGLTSLAEQFGAWNPASPVKGAADDSDTINTQIHDYTVTIPSSEPTLDSDASPMRSTFFEDEILVHADLKSPRGHIQPQASQNANDDETIAMEDIVMTDEDVALAVEANNMSLKPRQQHAHEGHDAQHAEDTLSEASQEYGDENQIPVDPALSARRYLAPVTPARPSSQKSYFTTTKVPLKPADDSEPSPSKKRSFSASRISSKNSGNLPRSATVISYSPTKEKRRATILPGEDPFSTPVKGDVWSIDGTPGRTPRRDANPALLRGAVVFVDVHTTEGADASGIFVELLSQMGAKCVKTWHWNPSGSLSGEGSSSKVGITHVVFKDGGKRTMEKVRESNGVVHCVGVSWVLE